MDIGNVVLSFVTFVIQVFSFFLGGYYIFVSLFAWLPRKELPKLNDKIHKFALIISAHDEETVIQYGIESLKRLDYPRDKYDIFVIADNCSDRTAEIARASGARVYERFDRTQCGKGYALQWFFKRFFELDEDFDCVCIFDADNVVSRNFLSELNKEHQKGFRSVQGNIDSKNPYDTWITTAYSVSFWLIGKWYQQARYNIGLTTQLSGTGFSIDVELLKEMGWDATCLTEDMEFTAKLVMKGYRVGWAHHAIVFDERPLSLAQSWRQRKRWMQGHADVASKYLSMLLKRSVRERDFSAFDCAIYLMQPLKAIALAVVTIITALQFFYPTGEIACIHLNYVFSPVFGQILTAANFLYLPFTVTYEKREFNFDLLVCYLTYWLYSFTWIPITIQGFIKKNNKVWSHTKHVRAIDIREIEKV